MANSNRAATCAISAGNARIYTVTICKSAADCEKIASREVNTAASRLKSACNGDVAGSFESNITARSGDRIQRNIPPDSKITGPPAVEIAPTPMLLPEATPPEAKMSPLR